MTTRTPRTTVTLTATMSPRSSGSAAVPLNPQSPLTPTRHPRSAVGHPRNSLSKIPQATRPNSPLPRLSIPFRFSCSLSTTPCAPPSWHYDPHDTQFRRRLENFFSLRFAPARR
ncbi:hypothetical protein K438DRAFT_1806347, partial [Mycena galopus ATCC 62051]